MARCRDFKCKRMLIFYTDFLETNSLISKITNDSTFRLLPVRLLAWAQSQLVELAYVDCWRQLSVENVEDNHPCMLLLYTVQESIVENNPHCTLKINYYFMSTEIFLIWSSWTRKGRKSFLSTYPTTETKTSIHLLNDNIHQC